MDGFEEIKVSPPRPGACKICAVKHNPAEPHDRDSLYYQNRFRKKYKRFPTWADAMAHCSQPVKARWRAKLIEKGVSPEDLGENGQ